MVYVPSNIKEFAKEKGILSTVNQVARWIEKSGGHISGGTAIGKYYDTLILDLTYQGSEIYISVDTLLITFNDIVITDYKAFKKVWDSRSQK